MKKRVLLFLCALTLAGCSVKEQETEITLFSSPVTAVYTGKVKNKIPEGDGRAVMDASAVIEGLFEQGVFVAGIADRVPYRTQYEDAVISGIYTGEVSDRLPSGTGEFLSDTFSYSGTWIAGKPDGTGTLTAEPFRLNTPDGVLEGSYQGDVNRGMAEGTGTFLYQEGSTEIRMEGSFAANQFDGTLIRTIRYPDTEKSYPVFYRNGSPVSDTVSLIAYLEGMRNESYCLSDAQLSFLREHSALFEGNEDAGGSYNEAFDYEAFTENDTPSLIRIDNAAVKSVQRYRPYAGSDTVTSMIVENSDGWYHLVFARSVDEAKAGEIMSFCALPLCRSTITAPEEDYPAIDAAGAAVVANR